MFVYCLYNDGVNDSKVGANETTFFSIFWRMTPMPKMPKMLLNSDSNAKSLLNTIYAQMIVLIADVCNFTQVFAFSRN